ncbi:EutP/PduV family microcompartment system protein [Ferrimonas aestuarii]|uniref:Ethanolamine utilization protein n=1 Tax=Ferrimonas aestuarii TaxID=2569539 RepID=A0A4U1BSH7_9GAMM|nr:EutP/PduV family microcompartment system protein [Ferrimonas aestuarii]TKB56577.1 ethanolamine utilization protein [Ferrimonas aestuarii]
MSLQTELKNVAFVGEVDAGKSALIDKLVEQSVHIGKTQSPNIYRGRVIDTPGEFIDNRAWNNALLSTISMVKTVVCLQPANAKRFSPVPGLLNVYANKNIVGVISKTDVDDADIELAKSLMREANIPEPYWEVSIFDSDSLSALLTHLLSLQAPK